MVMFGDDVALNKDAVRFPDFYAGNFIIIGMDIADDDICRHAAVMLACNDDAATT